MKLKTTCLLLAASLLAVFHTNAKTTDMELTPKQQSLVAIAAMEAKGDIEGLRKALNDGFEQGLTVSEAKEALSAVRLHRISPFAERAGSPATRPQ